MEMDTIGDQEKDQVPKYGLKLALNHEYPLQSKQIIKPSAKQMFEMMPLTTRYLKYYVGKRMSKKKPIMDYIHMISAQRMYGCPIGGIGGGTIGRGYKGEFCRFQLYPGIYEHITVPECQFIVNIRNGNNETIFQSVLSTYNKPKKAPSTWEWNLNGADCQYTALYPRAWTTYDLSKYGVKLVCRQISPVIPHNYKDSSLPCAVFVFTATNIGDERREVSVTQTWTEIPLRANKKKHLAKLELERYSEENTCGVSLEQRVGDASCTFTVAKRKDEKETIHEGYCLWSAAKTAGYVWECLRKHGRLAPDPSLTPPPPRAPGKTETKLDEREKKKEKNNKIYKCDSIGLSSVIALDPGGRGTTEFCLAWDMPVIKYKKDKKIHRRYYTKYFGSDGIAGASIAAYALKNYKYWERQLAEWQDPILTNNNIPDWLKSALMNELYYVADGGTIWFDVAEEFPDGDPRHDFGLFGYLEGHEYRMYSTYDVHFYASFALAQLWPNLQVVLQYMFRDTIALESEKCRKSLYDGQTVRVKVKDSIPHDLGDPDDVPFSHINAYNIHDVSSWRDLNLKFVLQVARDRRLLRAHSAPFAGDRYRSMAYIDDVRGGAELDLYARSTGQAPPASARTPPASPRCTPAPPAPAPAPPAPPAPAPAPPAPPRPRDILDLLYRTVEDPEELESRDEDQELGAAVWDAARYVTDMYPACAALVRRAARMWDADGDGLIENGGFPDQTYDAWVMSGPSAYCGGLWLGAVASALAMARTLSLDEDVAEFASLLERARAAFEDKLWNGSYYRFDTRPENEHVVMSDQLAGHWFLRASGITEKVFPEAHVRKALACIYENNVLRFQGGRMGAVNGFALDRGRADPTALQSGEVWVGVVSGLAATMLYEGMHEEAFKTAGGLYNTLTQMGLAFETPEALYENGNHRSIAYMRPLAIWGMYQAIISRPPAHTPVANGQVAKENHVNGL